MRHKVTLIPGEGIGPEVCGRCAAPSWKPLAYKFDWEEFEARAEKASATGQFVTAEAVESVRRNRVALKGPMGTAIAGGAPSINVALRKALDLYANVRPVKNLPA